MTNLNRFQKILVTGFDKSNLDRDIWQQVRRRAQSITFDPVASVDCLFARFNKVDKAFIDRLPHLKYIGLLATGTGTVDLGYAKSKGVTVCNVPGYATESVAEWVFALILERLREIERSKQVSRKGDFSGNGFSVSEIKGKKFGVIGLGRIGKRVAEIAQGFGAKVYYWSRHRKPDAERAGIRYEALDKVIATSDILSLHLLTTAETEGILNAARIASIKKSALLVNVSGMELVDLPALLKRLKRGTLDFIFDHPDEMAKNDVDSLAKYSQHCAVYPPIGWASQEARVAKQEIFLSNLENFLKGKTTNIVS